MYILGINFAYHELSACLLKDGKLLAAVEEERFSRIKRGKKALVNNPDVIPISAIQYCLNKARISFNDIEYIGLSFFPPDRLRNIGTDPYFTEGDWGSESGEREFNQRILRVPQLLSKMAGYDVSPKIKWIPHHICHASSAFFVSPFKESAILSLDGIGEFSSTWMGYGNKNKLELIKEIEYPNSIGFLWEKFSKYLGFTEYDSSKIMGLAAYGDTKKFYPILKKIVTLKKNGEFKINNEIMRFRINDFKPLEKLFGVRKIDSPSQISKDQEDIAAGLQKITNDVVLHLSKFLQEKTSSQYICLAGGVALNCISNAEIMKSALYKNIYIQPAANDAGTALGAAYYIWNVLLNGKRKFIMEGVYWGPEYSDTEILSALKKANLKYKKSKNITTEVARRLAEGNIVGWFQGRAEWGPRALGNRSLLADPRRGDMKKILNDRIKKREPFRPFAPSVLSEKIKRWFLLPNKTRSISTRFMEINCEVIHSKQSKIPAVTHNDGTSRIQSVDTETNPKYHKLIKKFYEFTGVPMVLNTSFNDNEPIVCSPEDAIRTFLRTDMDCLVIGNFIIDRLPIKERRRKGKQHKPIRSLHS